jgi:hypothetical protein
VTPLRGAWALLVCLHLALLWYAFPPGVVLGDSPFGGPDYQTHYQHTHTLMRVQAEFGRAWAYDPNLLAGHPTGLIFDVDNKLHFGFTRLLHALGLALPAAFNLFSVLTTLLAPLSLWLTARLLGAGPPARAVAFGLGVLLWHFDPTSRFCWAGGMVSFATAAHLCALTVALMHRVVHDGRPAFGLALAAMLPLTLRAHVWSFAALVVPLTALYLAHLRRLPRRSHLMIWTAAVLGLLANLDWLVPALAHRELIVPSAKLGQATPAYILSDFFELLIDPRNTGFVVPRMLLRTLAIAGAVGTVWWWRRERDPRAFTGAVTLGWLLALTYFGALVPAVAATEPYRFAVPLALWAGALAGPWLTRAWSALRALPRAARGAVAVLALLAAPRLYLQVAAFVPELSPTPTLSGAQALLATASRLAGVTAETASVRTWLAGQPDTGRVLVQFHPLGEYLRWSTDRPVLGGFPDRRMIFQDANLFYFPARDVRYGPGFAAYLERYNVAYVVMTYPYVAAVERRTDLLAPAGIHGGLHRAYRVKKPSGYFMTGSGRVAAGLNRIAVTEARPEPGTQALILRYHWMSELRCRPNCRVERAPVDGDTAGFIRVIGEPTLPAAFTVTLDYDAP